MGLLDRLHGEFERALAADNPIDPVTGEKTFSVERIPLHERGASLSVTFGGNESSSHCYCFQLEVYYEFGGILSSGVRCGSNDYTPDRDNFYKTVFPGRPYKLAEAEDGTTILLFREQKANVTFPAVQLLSTFAAAITELLH